MSYLNYVENESKDLSCSMDGVYVYLIAYSKNRKIVF
jgi:hypothetical protein